MSETLSSPKTARLFMNGRSQAVRLPLEFRFDGTEVFIRRNADGEVILSPKNKDPWPAFFQLVDTLTDHAEMSDFFADRDNLPPQERSLFEDMDT